MHLGHGIGGRVNEFVVGREPDDSMAVSSGIWYRRTSVDVGSAIFGAGERSKTVQACKAR
jgi:hypothetical protein